MSVGKDVLTCILQTYDKSFAQHTWWVAITTLWQGESRVLRHAAHLVAIWQTLHAAHMINTSEYSIYYKMHLAIQV